MNGAREYGGGSRYGWDGRYRWERGWHILKGWGYGIFLKCGVVTKGGLGLEMGGIIPFTNLVVSQFKRKLFS